MTHASKSSRRDFIRTGLLLLASTPGLPALGGGREDVKVAPAADAPFDLREFMDAAIKAGKRRIIVPPGRYRVTPRQSVHLHFKDLVGTEIVARGVEMVCTETSRAMSFERCRNVRLEGLTVDYDPLPFTEGRITAVAPDQSWFEFDVFNGYPPFRKLNGRVELFDPDTKELRREISDSEIETIESLGGNRYRLVWPKGHHEDKGDAARLGDILVTNQRSPGGTGDHAVVSTDCAGLTLEEVTLHASPLFGFLELRCDGSTYRRCKIDRRPPTEDPVPRGYPRLRSLNADAFHCSQAAKGPAILNCTAKFQDDDCVNIHGIYHLVTASHGRQLRVAAIAGRLTIRPGDTVEFIPCEGKRPPNAVAVKIEPDAPISDTERAYIQKRPMDEHLRQELLGDQTRFFRITLDRAVPLAMGSGVCSSARVGNGCRVTDCDFGYNRSRGILIKASHARVTGNRIAHGWMSAVLVAPEFCWWLEAASASDVLIEGNTILGCRGPAIKVTARDGHDKLLPSGAHRDIAIKGNSISGSVWPNIYVTSTDGLVVSGNHLTPVDAKEFVPPLTQPWDWKGTKPTPILVELCDQPKVQSNDREG